MATTKRIRPPLLIAHLAGGLGNQMFIYAAARCLSIRHGFELVLDTESGFSIDQRYKRAFELHHLNLPKDLLERSLAYRAPNRWILSIRRRIEQKLPESRRSWLLDTPGGAREALPRTFGTRPTRLEGYWQDERHFSSCSELISKELVPPESVARACSDVLRMIRLGDSIAVHLRLRDPPIKSTSRNELTAYYRAALAVARSHAPKASLFAFSDDVPKAKGLLKAIGEDSTFPPTGSAVRDMLMISRCRVLVLAPSTFSWWAAWLSRTPDKVVIAPELNDGWGFAGMLRPDWIRIQTGVSTKKQL